VSARALLRPRDDPGDRLDPRPAATPRRSRHGQDREGRGIDGIGAGPGRRTTCPARSRA